MYLHCSCSFLNGYVKPINSKTHLQQSARDKQFAIKLIYCLSKKKKKTNKKFGGIKLTAESINIIFAVTMFYCINKSLSEKNKISKLAGEIISVIKDLFLTYKFVFAYSCRSTSLCL